MHEYTVKIVCKVHKRKKFKRMIRVTARTYRDAVRAARDMGRLFGRVRIEARMVTA